MVVVVVLVVIVAVVLVEVVLMVVVIAVVVVVVVVLVVVVVVVVEVVVVVVVVVVVKVVVVLIIVVVVVVVIVLVVVLVIVLGALTLLVYVKFAPLDTVESTEGSRIIALVHARFGVDGQKHAGSPYSRGGAPLAIAQEAVWAPGPVWTGVDKINFLPQSGFEHHIIQPLVSIYRLRHHDRQWW